MPRQVLIKIRRGTEAQLPVLDVGELGFCTDTNKLYIGTPSGNQLLVAAQSVGDMLKSIYDTDSDGKVDAAETADSVPWSGVTGKPSVFPPDVHTHDDRYYTEAEASNLFAKRQGYSANISSVGWYRIASNGSVSVGRSGGTRAHAMFTVRDTQSGFHSAVTFYASYHFGNNPTITVLNRSWYGSQGIIKKIRLIEGNTYEGAAIEVYCGATGTVDFTIYDNEHVNGWTPVNWANGSIPSGFTVTQIDLDTYDPVFAIAANGVNNMFYIQRNGQGTFMPRGPITWNQLKGV